MAGKHGQSAMELVILVGAMMFVFITLLAVFQQSVSRRATEQRDAEFTELALTVQNEIAIAASATDGYQRTFILPETVRGLAYNITLVSQSVYIISENSRHALSLPIQNATGEIFIGDNIIRKINGEVLLN